MESLLVPSVIELAKDPLASIPERFLHHDLDPPFDSDKTHNDQLPVISMDSLLKEDPTEFAKLHDACSNWGFFQLVSHGVNTDLMERFKVVTKELFELPIEEKMKYWHTPNDIEGFGQKLVVAEDQKLGWVDPFLLSILPLEHRKPHLLPFLPIPFRESLESYTTELKQLATKLFDFMAKDLNIDREEFRRLFDDGRQSIRIGYYPPCRQYDKVIGSRPHSDVGALTILHQLNQVDGLQIRKDGRWLPITPFPNAFIINIGNIMEIVSNGIYSSVEHRVMVNPKSERLSAASFFHAKLDAEVGPASSLVTSDSPARFTKITTAEYLNGYYAKPLIGKSSLDSLRIDHN